MLVERVLVVDRDAVAEHDGIGDLHHRRLEVQRQQHTVFLRHVDLLGVEVAQRSDVHHRGVDDLARLQWESLSLSTVTLPSAIDELDLDVAGLVHGGRGLGFVEVLAGHVDDRELGAGLGPGLHHLVGFFLGECLDCRGRSDKSRLEIELTAALINSKIVNYQKDLLTT